MALSVQNWAIPIEISGFLCETTTLQRQHVILKSFSLHFFVCSALSTHTSILKFQTILTSFDKYNKTDESFSSKTTLKLKINSNDL